VYSQNGAISSNYVTPTIQVGEDAYVFALEMDLDGQIQVLHPEYPGISVRIRQQEQFRLRNFFGGYPQRYAGLSSYSGYNEYAGYDGYEAYGADENDTRGTVIALASRVPFNLGRLERDGDWNISTIRDLIDRRSPLAAAQALASYIGAKDEPIGRDVLRFASNINNFYASNYRYGCGLFGGLYSSPYALSPLSVFVRVAQLRNAGQNVSILGYDACGMPIVVYGPRTVTNGFPRPPRTHDDSVRAKRGIPRQPGFVPPRTEPNAAAYGYFPVITRRAQPQRGDSAGSETRARPEIGQRRVAPGEIIIDRRAEPEREIIIDRRAEPEREVVGVQPPREQSRPVLRESPSPSPRRESAPPRMEPTQSSPPPQREAEQPRFSPPPRVESPAPRSEPTQSPPTRMEPRNDPPPPPRPAAAAPPRIITRPVETASPPPKR
jgi:hypothetical protein